MTREERKQRGRRWMVVILLSVLLLTLGLILSQCTPAPAEPQAVAVIVTSSW